MTDLQLGLLVIGGLAVAGVLAYNRWQERSLRRSAERSFGGSRHADVLLEGSRTRREPTFQAKEGAIPDARVDYIIELKPLHGIGYGSVLEAWRPLAQRFAGRVLLSGDDGAGWRAGLQLVTRAGPVGEAELVEFRAQVETLASRIGAAVSAPELRQALDAARELDRACAQADIQVALHVVGIAPDPDLGKQPFHVAPREDGLTLTLDVARTPEPARSFDAMARTARQLGGRVVDDNGNALDERALAAIGVELEGVRRMLSERGIEPGSALALRLFS